MLSRLHGDRPDKLAPGGEESRPLTAREVAARCGVELKTVHGWADKGLIAHFRTPGRHLRFRAPDVDRFLARQSRATPAVLVVGARATAASSRGWLFVADPYDALLRVGASSPLAVVLVSAGLTSVRPVPMIRALVRRLPGARLVWVGGRVPPGLDTRVERARNLAAARVLLAA